MSAEREIKAKQPPRNDTFLRLTPEERAVVFSIREVPFGSVEIVVHQSRIVQITKTEKVRV